MNTSTLQVLDLEAQLAADHSGEFLRRSIAEFQQELAETKRKISEGLAPDEYQAATAYTAALEAACEVLQSLWNREHKTL